MVLMHEFADFYIGRVTITASNMEKKTSKSPTRPTGANGSTSSKSFGTVKGSKYPKMNYLPGDARVSMT